MKEELFESIFNEEMNTAYAVKDPVTKEGKVKKLGKDFDCSFLSWRNSICKRSI